MLIENPEQFKAWLTSVLEPLCDADPSALAKYVYALVKKDKTLEELRVGMVEQLDVFLQQETQNFVELLFKTLETQEYIGAPNTGEVIKEETVVERTSTPPSPNLELSASPKDKEAEEPECDLVTQSSTDPVPALSVHLNGTAVSSLSSKKETEKEEKEKEKQPRSRTGRVRSRTRSRSWDRDRRRSRSREHSRRDRELRDRSRPWRNKSPPLNMRHNRHDRRRSRSRSLSPMRSRLREGPECHRPRFRNRTPSPGRSRSRSLDRKKDRIDRPDRSPGSGTPTQDSNHGDVDMRLSSTSQTIQSVVTVASNVPTNNQGSFQPKRRCRDFDEKGYCMRGDLCTYDHGVDPVVLEDIVLTRVLNPHSGLPFQGPGAVGADQASGPNGNAPPPHLPLGSLPPPNLRNQHQSNMDVLTEYNPDAPSMEPQVPWGRHPPGPVMYGRGQRELINVPVDTHANAQEHNSHPPQNPLKRKQPFDFNRLGPKQRAVHNPTNCSLELKKVPRGLNNITQLNNHFSKFGKIVNIQVNFNADPEAALVTFQLPTEAKSAYRSTEAVLNNRFIKVFWHNSSNAASNNAPTTVANASSENVPPTTTRPSVKDRLGTTVTSPPKTESSSNENEYVPTRRVKEELDRDKPQQTPMLSKPLAPPPPTREDKVLAIKKTQEILAAKESIKKKQEEKRKEVIKISSDIRKRKQDLLDKQLLEMKVLIDKVEKNPEQKDVLMSSIKHLQQSIDNIRKDIASNNQAPASKAALPKTVEQAKKEILDAELDLISAQQEGGDVTDLQKRLNELKAHAATLEINSTSASSRGARSSRGSRGGHAAFRGGRGRGATSFSAVHNSIDHRPTSLLVSGYESEEKDDVLTHFQQYGEILNPIVDDATPSIVINYKSRKEAEVAMLKGRTFQDRLLSITWVSGHHLHRGGIGGNNSGGAIKVSSAIPGSEQLQPITDEEIDLENVADIEALLLDENEEEEDEDGESRSWRR